MTDSGPFGMTTWTDLWAECTERLGSSDEARHIIEQASGRSGASWLITLTTQAPQHAVERVSEMVQRRLTGEPLQYVLGRWSFRQLSLHVDRRVLIPRPETEQMVDAAIETTHGVMRPKIVDLGTGSGAIALSLAVEVHEAEIWATDVSTDSLDVADRNLNDLPPHASQRVRLLHGSWFDALPDELRGDVDLLVSNPPYVAERDRAEVDPVVRDWEPEGALFAGDDGMDAINIILEQGPQWLSPRGALVVEIAPDQAEIVERRALDAGFFAVAIGTDLARRKRWVVATKAAK